MATAEPVAADAATLILSELEQDRSGNELLKVAVVGAGGVCSEGVVRVPLEITLGGISRRLVVSISIEQE